MISAAAVVLAIVSSFGKDNYTTTDKRHVDTVASHSLGRLGDPSRAFEPVLLHKTCQLVNIDCMAVFHKLTSQWLSGSRWLLLSLY